MALVSWAAPGAEGREDARPPLSERQREEWRSRIRSTLFLEQPPPDLAPEAHGRFSPARGVVAERVSYGTEFGMRVPAILYLPETVRGKVPALIVVNGHGGDKFAWYAAYAGVLYARAGAAVLTYDPVGEGERNASRKSGSRAHDAPQSPPEMARRLAGLMITDIMQAVSYLERRPEVDPRRIGAMGYSLGSFILALAGAVDVRLNACVLVGGGNLDGPDGYWDRSKPMCQGIPYRSLLFLGDRPAALYALHAARGPTLVYNGLADQVVAIPSHGEGFFADLRERTARLTGDRAGLFEVGFVAGASHRPFFVTRPVALWLERRLDFPSWSEADIEAMPETQIGPWAKAQGVPLDPLYASEEREGGTRALGSEIPGVPRETLFVFSPEEWERRKPSLVYEGWVDEARARTERVRASDPAIPGPAREPAGRRPVERGEVTFPPRLPRGQAAATDTSDAFLRPPASLRPGVAIARTPPTIDFLYYPGQDYPGSPWSCWGDGLATRDRYYSAIGDHRAIGAKEDGPHGTGTALVYEYDPEAKALRLLADVARVLDLPAGHYTPGKVHTRLDLGRDGWLYFATHRGSEKSAIDRYHYRGDWILRCDPRSGQSEAVVHGPVPKHSIPCGLLDPDRMIFYGGTAAGPDSDRPGIQFFAYDVDRRRLLHAVPDGPSRCLIFARSTGRVYYVAGADEGPLWRYDPGSGGPPVAIGGRIGVRAATAETPQGVVYTVSSGQKAADANLWSFDTATEASARIGTAAVGTEAYIASIDADPAGRYLYYIPGAHGSSDRDGSPVVQLDARTGRKKVLAFLHPFYHDRYGLTLKGTYSSAISPGGDTLYVTWNVSRGGRGWDCCGLTAIHIPESERQP